MCGCAGAVKRDRLKICWLSAYEGSNPFTRINFKYPFYLKFLLRVNALAEERFLYNKMTKSKTKISKQAERKTNPLLVEIINSAKKNNSWKEIAEKLASPRKNRKNINVSEINKTEGDVIVVGKVLSQGDIHKKRKIVALNFSKKAEEKLKKAGCEVITISEEIKKNPEMKGLKILKNG